MRILKRFVIILLVLAGLITVIGFFLPRTVEVSRSAIIPAPQWQVYMPVADLTQWNQWAKWNQMDPDMQVEWGDIQVGEGASYSWTSEHPSVGNGAMTITQVQGMDRLDMEMDFAGQGTAQSSFSLTTVPEGTGVTWAMITDMGAAPWGRWFGLFMDGLIGADFEEGLANLEAYVTGNPSELEIQKVDIPAKHILYVQQRVPEAEMQQALQACYGKVATYAQSQGVSLDGAPFAMYDYPSEGFVVITAGIPVEKPVEGNAEISYRQFQPTQALKANCYGNRDKVDKTYGRLADMANKYGATPVNNAGPLGWEEYQLNQESATLDTTREYTEVYVPIRSLATLENEELAN